MKNKYLKILLAIISLLSFLLIFGCDTTDNPVETPDNPLTKPTNLSAFSKSSTEVGLTWTKSVDVTKTEFNSYVLKVKSGITIVKTEYPTKTDTIWTVTGLTEGTIYKFVLSTRTQKGTIGDSVEVTWSPAKRINTIDVGTAIKVYDFKSTNYPSGLDFQNSTGNAEVVSIAASNPNSARADLYVYNTSATDSWEIRSPKLSSVSVPKTTSFSTSQYDVNTLDDPRATPPDVSTYTLDKVTIGIGTVTAGKILFAKTQEKNYARILILKGTNNSLVQGTYPDRYIEVKISFQSTIDNPYAKKVK